MGNGEFQVDQFINIFDQRIRDQANEGSLSGFGSVLKAEFDDVARRRSQWEDRWLKDLRQCKDIYDPEVRAKFDENQSQAFIPKTRTKKNALSARLLELFFPANGEQNWDIQPSPEPTVSPYQLEQEAINIQQSGEDPGSYSKSALQHKVAERACDYMRQEMKDQLANRFGRPSYRETISHVVDHGLTYGTGVLKGPMVEYASRENWVFVGEENQWKMQGQISKEPVPYKEFVSIWDSYPDLDAVDVRQARFHWQTHLKTSAELQEMAEMPYFVNYKTVIYNYLKDYPQGDASWRNHEVNLRDLGQDGSVQTLKNRYRVYERWGYLKGEELVKAGLDVPEDKLGLELPTNIWLLGDKIIKAVIEPIKGVVIPYYYWYFSKDETAIFGDSLATVLRDSQSALNSTVRAMLDNSSISSGPQVGVNVSALHPDNGDPTKIGKWGVWLFDNAEDMQKVLNIWEIPNYIQHYLALIKYLTDLMDEITTPRFMQGDGQVSGAGRTAQGLSMLMGAAHIVLKDLVRQFDDGITRPFITALYHWNMQFNQRDNVKGDYQVQATGSTSLVAKEVQVEKLMQVAQITENPRFAGRVKDDELLQEVFRSMDVKTSMVRSDAEFETWQEKQVMQQERARAKANLEVLMDEVQGRGMDPNEVLKQLFGEQIKQFSQNGSAGQGQVSANKGQSGQVAEGTNFGGMAA